MRIRALVLIALFCATARADERPAPAEPASAESRSAAWAQHQALRAASPFEGLKWRSVGPVVQGGRVVDIEAVPGNPYAFYVAYASGGLWYTENNGQSFEPLFDDQPTLIMGDVAVDPSNPKRVWVGTGENNSSRSSYGGFGIFLSEDGGKTWASKGLLESDRIGKVQIDPRDGNRVFVAALGKLYTPGGQRGVYRTTDGGASWSQVLPGQGFTGAIDVQIDPKNPDTVYAATWDRERHAWDFREGGPGSAIWKSIDGGTTWKRLGGGLPTDNLVGRIGLSICQAKPEVLYASVDHQGPMPESEWDLGGPLSGKRVRKMSTEAFLTHSLDEIQGFVNGLGYEVEFGAKELVRMLEAGEITLARLLDKMSDANASLFNTDIRGLEVYRSNDGGATWVRTHDQPLKRIVHTYGYYFGVIRVAPDDPERVYIAGVPLLTSADGGRTWSSLQHRSVHVDYHEIWIDPAASEHMIVGNDGGLDVTFDRGTSWRKVDAQAVGQFYTVTVDTKKAYQIYGGTQDNGTWKGAGSSRPGRDEWKRIGGGDGMYVQVDPRDGTVYFGYQFGFYSRRGPDGRTAAVRPKYGLDDEPLRYNWSTPVLLSSHNADVVYFGCNRLFRSMDQGRTFKAISPDLTRSKQRGDVPFACITTISESPETFGHVWVGTDDGYVHVTKDGGTTWQERTAGLPRDRWCTRVRASLHAPDRAYVTFNGYRNDDIQAYVYVTDDDGKTWRSISAGLPAEAVNVILEAPGDADRLYVGTDRGVYVSFDRGASWEALMGGLPPVPVHDLVIQPKAKVLVAATHGRSFYVLRLAELDKVTAALRDKDLHLFPQADLRVSRGWRHRNEPWQDQEGGPKRYVAFWTKAAGPVTLEVRDGDKRVLRTVTFEASRGLNRHHWNLHVDRDVALASELAANAAAKVAPAGKAHRGHWPQREAARMGWPAYISAGAYTLVLRQGERTTSAPWKVKAPTSRVGKKPKDDGRPPADR